MPERQAIPFNISLLELTDAKIAHMRPVTSLDFLEGNSTQPHPNGLFSAEIFGKVGDEARMKRFSYINIKVQVFHPVVFRALVALKRLYGDILSGQEYATWNGVTKDFERSDVVNGQTGYHFFAAHWKEMIFPETRSAQREQNIALIQRYKSRAMTSRILVLPAGLRDLEYGPDGRMREDEINTIYRSLIAKSNSITDAVLKANPEMINPVRYYLQNTFNQLYDLLEAMVEGKRKLILGKWASRRIFDGTRNVITAMNTSAEILGHPGNVGYNSTVSGLYQALKAGRPVAVFHIKNGFLTKVFPGPGQPAKLVDMATKHAVHTDLKPEYYDRWMTTEGIEKLLTAFSEEDVRHKPIIIDNKYLGLVYKGPDKTFRFVQDIDELPPDRDPKDLHPLTFCELLYLSTYREMNKLPAFVTRYPITGMGSIVPSKLHVKTTIRSEQRKELGPDWSPLGDDYVAYEFPIEGGEFVNSIAPHTSKLARLGADFDGDTSSMNVTYTDESIREIDEFLNSKRAYVGTDGRPIASIAISTVDLVLYNLTGD
jgi:hypothetical protein